MQSPRSATAGGDSSSESEDASQLDARTSSPTVPSTVPRTFRTNSSGIEPGWSVSSSNTRKSTSALEQAESPLEKGSLTDLFEDPDPYSAQRKGEKENSDVAGLVGDDRSKKDEPKQIKVPSPTDSLPVPSDSVVPAQDSLPLY